MLFAQLATKCSSLNAAEFFLPFCHRKNVPAKSGQKKTPLV
jgi:hypothetical protein